MYLWFGGQNSQLTKTYFLLAHTSQALEVVQICKEIPEINFFRHFYICFFFVGRPQPELYLRFKNDPPAGPLYVLARGGVVSH